MKTAFYAISLGFLAIRAVCPAQGTLLAGHFGSANPTSEGFTILAEANPSLAAVSGDLGRDAWHIGLTEGGIAQYRANLGSLGPSWELSLTVRVLPPFNTPSSGTYVSLSTGTEYYILLLGAQPNGDPAFSLQGGQYSLSGAGSGYHHYQLRGDAATHLASLWTDGAMLVGGVEGYSSPNPPGFSWGGGQNPWSSVNANWSEVSLWAVPEPSALPLILLGTLVFSTRRLRARRKARVKP